MTDEIAELDVSETWKEKFRLIEKAGGPTLPNFNSLPFGERLKANFNILAFLLGPIYFIAKGLWRQGVLYFVMAIVLIFILEIAGLGKYGNGIGYGFAAIYAVRANVCYYKKVVLGDVSWL